MKNIKLSIKSILLYGFLIWLIPFVVSIAIFPIRTSNRPLFESIMAVTLVAAVVYFTVSYLKKDENVTLKDGLVLGLVWIAISLFFDFFLFIRGPFTMTVDQYISDIGVTYLLIPVITVGFSYLVNVKTRMRNPA